jgi:hypothetical protein
MLPQKPHGTPAPLPLHYLDIAAASKAHLDTGDLEAAIAAIAASPEPEFENDWLVSVQNLAELGRAPLRSTSFTTPHLGGLRSLACVGKGARPTGPPPLARAPLNSHDSRKHPPDAGRAQRLANWDERKRSVLCSRTDEPDGPSSRASAANPRTNRVVPTLPAPKMELRSTAERTAPNARCDNSAELWRLPRTCPNPFGSITSLRWLAMIRSTFIISRLPEPTLRRQPPTPSGIPS